MMDLPVLNFALQFWPQITAGRKFHTFRRDHAALKDGDRVKLRSDGVAMDTTVTRVLPVHIGRSHLIEGGIASISVGGVPLNAGEIELFAILDGFGRNDRTGSTARIRMGHFLEWTYPGGGALDGHVICWMPPSGLAAALQAIDRSMAEGRA